MTIDEKKMHDISLRKGWKAIRDGQKAVGKDAGSAELAKIPEKSTSAEHHISSQIAVHNSTDTASCENQSEEVPDKSTPDAGSSMRNAWRDTLARYSQKGEKKSIVSALSGEEPENEDPGDFDIRMTSIFRGMSAKTEDAENEPGEFRMQSEGSAEPGAAAVSSPQEAGGSPDEISRELVSASVNRDLGGFNELLASLESQPPETVRATLEKLTENGAGGFLCALDSNQSAVTPEDCQAFFRHLSAITAKAGDPQLTDKFAYELSKYAKDTERSPAWKNFADAARVGIAAGSDAGLAVALAKRRASNDNFDNTLMPALAAGFNDLYNNVADQGGKVQVLNNEANYLIDNYRPMMSEDELNAALEEFRGRHSEYSRLEELSAGAVANIEHMQQFIAINGNRSSADLDLHQAARAASLALASTSGKEALGRLLAREGEGQETWISNLETVLGSSEEDEKARKAIQSSILVAGTSSAASALGQGSREEAFTILEGIKNTGGFGEELDAEQQTQLLDAYKGMIDAAVNGDVASLNTFRDNLGDLVDNKFHLTDSTVQMRLKTAGAFLSATGAAISGLALFEDGATAREWTTFIAGTVEGGCDVFEIAFPRLFSGGVRTASTMAASAGVIFGIADTVGSFRDGDTANGAINAAGTLGSAMMLIGPLGAGAACSGVGAVLSLGALVGGLSLGQYRKVQASNRFESEDTELFLRHALADSGLSGEELHNATYHLRNADDEGRLTGFLIQAAAEQMGMDPGKLLNLLAQLNPDRLEYLITEGHKVDPTDDNNPRSLDEQQVRDWINLLYDEGIEGLDACIAH